jgi:hypothetical protein
MRTIKTQTHYSTQPENNYPFFIQANITQEQENRIKKFIQLAKEEKISIKIDFDLTFLDEDNGESDFLGALESLEILSNGTVYFSSQDKYDSSYQIESSDISQYFN